MRDKNYFRKELKIRRKAFVEQHEFFAPVPAVRDSLMHALASSDVIAGYAALTAEPDVFPILEILRDAGKTIALPAMVEGSDAMVFCRCNKGAPLARSAHGFCQPPDDAPLLVPDVIFVPVVGFDRHYNRLGHGKGHFDRALADRPTALKIGVAWSVQEVPELPVDPWDVPLDAILTEREWRVREAEAR